MMAVTLMKKKMYGIHILNGAILVWKMILVHLIMKMAIKTR